MDISLPVPEQKMQLSKQKRTSQSQVPIFTCSNININTVTDFFRQ